MTKRTIRLSPSEYINEEGVLKNLQDIIDLHRYINPIILTDNIVREVIPPFLPEGFLDQYPLELFQGNATYEEIDRLTLIFKGYDVIIAFGGGQLLDTAKVVADQLNIAIINIPTIPSNCAAITTKSIIYSEGTHEMVGAHRQSQAVTVVLIEPKLLQASPYEYILSGIGDTLAKYYEIRCRLTKEKLQLTTALIGKTYIDLCRDEMFKVTEVQSLSGTELINFFDTIFLVAASVDGIADTDGQSVLAHAFYNAYVKFQKGSRKTHGEVVALGILFQLYIEKNQNTEIIKLKEFYNKIGLPITLQDINWNISDLEAFSNYITNPNDMRVQSIFPNLSNQDVLDALMILGG